MSIKAAADVQKCEMCGENKPISELTVIQSKRKGNDMVVCKKYVLLDRASCWTEAEEKAWEEEKERKKRALLGGASSGSVKLTPKNDLDSMQTSFMSFMNGNLESLITDAYCAGYEDCAAQRPPRRKQ